LLIIFGISVLIFPQPVKGQGVTITNPLTYDTFDELIKGVTGFLFVIATALVPLMIVIAGFYFLTASGNPQQVETAKKIILYTVVGYAIILISYGLITIIRDLLGST